MVEEEGGKRHWRRVVWGGGVLFLLLILAIPNLLSYVAASSQVRSLDVRNVRGLLERLGGASFSSRQVEIRKITPGLGGEAVVEARIETAYRLRQKENGWEVAEIRLGDRHWESLELIQEGVRREKIRRTRLQFRELSTALASHLTATGGYVEADSIEGLLDGLTVGHLRHLHWYDQWGTPFYYRGEKLAYQLRSAGPDGRHGTPDDLIADRSSSLPESR
jgi:hypothetical protein